MRRSGLCYRHSILRPRLQNCAASTTWPQETLYTWKEKFLEGGKDAVARSGTTRTLKRHAREVETLKRIIGEYAVANEALKKRWREAEDDGGKRGMQEHQSDKIPLILRRVQDCMILFQKAKGRGN